MTESGVIPRPEDRRAAVCPDHGNTLIRQPPGHAVCCIKGCGYETPAPRR
jgi:hypothetical protein